MRAQLTLLAGGRQVGAQAGIQRGCLLPGARGHILGLTSSSSFFCRHVRGAGCARSSGLSLRLESGRLQCLESRQTDHVNIPSDTITMLQANSQVAI
jgi:hypothetical protein